MEQKLLILLLASFVVVAIQAWSGNIEPYGRWKRTTCKRCICWYRRGCGYYRRFSCTVWTTDYRCKRGWRHLGDQNCIIPICYPGCNDGTCEAPNKCDCPTTATGDFCQTLVCSYQKPCYPGNCYQNDKCNCTQGFVNEPSTSGCLKMDDTQKAFIGRSTAIISHLRGTDGALLYYFLLDGTEDDVAKTVVWSNQQIFNRLSFQYEAQFNQQEEMADRPPYVHDTQLGIVYGDVRLQVFDFQGNTMERSKYNRTCSGVSDLKPATKFYNCTIGDIHFKTLVEDGDTLDVTFRIRSGGFRQLLNLDTNTLFPKTTFDGVEATKKLEFKFDFRRPKYCKENASNYPCPADPTILSVANEFTKDPISLRWAGWADTNYGSGMWYYYLELHPLVVKDARKTLTEKSPIKPVYSATIDDDGSDEYIHNITPLVPGMYSVLMDIRDVANNTRLCRRLVLYDPVSEITLDTTVVKGLHVPSAARETGYRWQATTDQDEIGTTRIDVSWEDYFVNVLHEDGAYLNEIQKYPVQFLDIKDDALMVEKFVDPYLDDHEGQRTNASIPNLRGIVKFEYRVVLTTVTTEPTDGWINVPGPNSRQTIQEGLANGQEVRIWVRAHDIMGNTKAASTVITLDSTNPVINEGSKKINMNDDSTEDLYDSSLEFEAEDGESGVHEIEMNIVMHTPGKGDREFNVRMPANVEPRTNDSSQQNCLSSKDDTKCFRRQQKVQMDNCWFMLPVKDDLAVSNATVDVTVYNQAMLTDTTQFAIPRLSVLSGLAIFSGPQNMTVTSVSPNSFRIVWSLPDQMSCYGQADINLVITYTEDGGTKKREHRVSAMSTYFDVGNVPPDTHFIILFSSTLGGGGTTPPESFSAQTSPVQEEEGDGSNLALILGVAGAILFLVILSLVLFFFAVRRGYIKPREKVRRVRRAATRVYRERVARSTAGVPRRKQSSHKTYYDNRQSELYIYGEMDLEGPQIWHLDRNDISLESQIKSGNFANIYKATLRSGQRSGEVVVAKTLQENHTPDEEMLMKAKTNFFGSAVGDHPNILKFIGAVVSDETLGPFMIYEYCDNGTLKEYLVSHKDDMSIEMQDNLFRFGLDIAKGMEYLAGKAIVHRRLAARNILLTFLNEVKISGFGPQPADEEVGGDAEQGKRERIPIKWMAPECMSSTKDATEKSDVWSYAVVLWEIFTMGETPYADIRGKDLPSRVKKGTRLRKPEQCDDTWYDVMTRCWANSPDKRPDFNDIRMELDNLFVAAPGDDYYYYKR